MKNKKLMMAIVAILVVGAGAFFGGMQYQKKKSPGIADLQNMSAIQRQTALSQAGSFGGRSGSGAGRNGGGFSGGQIIAKDDKSITVKDQNGSTKTIYFSDSTTVNKSAKGSSGDLSNGQNVTVTGTSNSDGSITADSIQIRPQ